MVDTSGTARRRSTLIDDQDGLEMDRLSVLEAGLHGFDHEAKVRHSTDRWLAQELRVLDCERLAFGEYRSADEPGVVDHQPTRTEQEEAQMK